MQTITSRRNPLAVHIKKLGASREYRYESGEFLCDGIKLLGEAVSCGAAIAMVMAASDLPFALPDGVELYNVPQDLLKSISPLKTAQEVLFTCRIPKTVKPDLCSGTHLLLDGVQDPGNLGTILRTAEAFGIESVLLTGGCADPYNPKTVRATMGALYRQCFYEVDYLRLPEICGSGTKIIGTSLKSGSRDISEVSLSNAIIAIGSEGRGLSDYVEDLCSERIKIPIVEPCESLNAAVAAAIIMWEASKCHH